MKSPPLTPTIQDMLITKKKAAKLLSISIRTLDRHIAGGRINKVYLGASPRVRLSEIYQIMERGA